MCVGVYESLYVCVCMLYISMSAVSYISCMHVLLYVCDCAIFCVYLSVRATCVYFYVCLPVIGHLLERSIFNTTLYVSVSCRRASCLSV